MKTLSIVLARSSASCASSLPVPRIGRPSVSLVYAALALLAPSISDACVSINLTASDVNIGQYNTLAGSAIGSTLSIHLECQADGLLPTIALPFSVGVSSANSGGADTKVMSGVRYNLLYGIYTSPNQVTPWGASGSSNAVSGLFPSALLPEPQVMTGYVSVPARQNVPSGSYTDSLTLTLEF